MQIVNRRHATTVRLTEPTEHGFLLLAAEIGQWWGPFPQPSGRRRRLRARIGPLVDRVCARPDVVEATAFRAALRPPGQGRKLLRGAGVRRARFDMAIVVETKSVVDLDAVRVDPAWGELVAVVDETAGRTHHVGACSPARIADVDHEPDHWFLFNYFHGPDSETVRGVWEFTAGWFQQCTELPNSVPMQPLSDEPDDYTLINHASWPTLRTFLPDLVFRPTFRSFVLANFAANNIAAQPIIYRRVR